MDTSFLLQFVVYSGYYYVLTLIFVGAGVYKLTSEGWIRSVRVCWETSPTTQPEPPTVHSGRGMHIQVYRDDDSSSESSSEDKTTPDKVI